MYIGVSDVGEITGIPSFKPIRYKHIHRYVKRSLNLIINENMKQIKTSDIGIKIHKLKVDKSYLYNEIDDIVNDWKIKKRKDLKKLHQYKVGFCEWYKVIS